jgi:hypothetical protein
VLGMQIVVLKKKGGSRLGGSLPVADFGATPALGGGGAAARRSTAPPRVRITTLSHQQAEEEAEWSFEPRVSNDDADERLCGLLRATVRGTIAGAGLWQRMLQPRQSVVRYMV